jgi:hypothetical protein
MKLSMTSEVPVAITSTVHLNQRRRQGMSEQNSENIWTHDKESIGEEKT